MKEREECIVVGAGLVGSLLAVFLARRGHPVRMFERRPDMRRATVAAGRSINLIGTERGLHAMERVGLRSAALEIATPVFGRTMHALDGTLTHQPYGRDDSESNQSLARGEINCLLMTEAEKAGATIAFEHSLASADLDAGRISFEDAGDGSTVEVEVGLGDGLVFGTDGAGSALRAAFEAATPGFRAAYEDLGHGYKELEIPPAADGSYRIDERALHIWPRGRVMLMALPNRDGSFTVTLYLPHEGEDGFASLRTPSDVRSFFERMFPDAVALLPRLEEEFFENPTGQLGTLRCAPYHHGGRALLLGDAAHAIVPFFGQGMNCGFEDCEILLDLMDRYETRGSGGDARETREAAFAAFTRERKPNADAIADMAIENFVEMCDRVGDPAFLLRKRAEHRLETELPGEYRTRYSMVVYSRIPYHLAREAGRVQDRILDRLCRGLERAEDLDLEEAAALVRSDLQPFLERNSIRLDY